MRRRLTISTPEAMFSSLFLARCHLVILCQQILPSAIARRRHVVQHLVGQGPAHIIIGHLAATRPVPTLPC